MTLSFSRNAAIFLALVGVGFALFAAVWVLRPPPGDEDRIRALIDGAVRAAEARRPGEVVAGVSERFQGQGQGEGAGQAMGRRELQQFVTFQTMRGSWNVVLPVAARIEVTGDRATAAVDAVLVRGAAGEGFAGRLPEAGNTWRIDLTLERERGEWKVVAASWRPRR